MRKRIIILIIGGLVIACNDKVERVKSEAPVEVDSGNIRKREAMAILDEVQGWMEKGVTKKLSVDKVNKEINPRMEKYQKLLKQMDKKDSTEVQNYRIKRINELVDLKIK